MWPISLDAQHHNKNSTIDEDQVVTMYNYVFQIFQELSPTSDTNIVRALMNLFDCLTDEFHDEAKVSQMEDREVVSWIEVKYIEKQTRKTRKKNKNLDEMNYLINLCQYHG